MPEPEEARRPPRSRLALLYTLFLVALWIVFGTLVTGGEPAEAVPYSRFRADLDAGRVTAVTIEPEYITYSASGEDGVAADGEPTRLRTVRAEDEGLVDRLTENGVEYEVERPPPGFLTPLATLLFMLVPLLLVWFLIARAMGGGRASPMSIGKSRAREIAAETITKTFDDAGGVDAVEEELKEVIDFLKNPERYKAMGARLPTGILLVGPPGTGKTLLAKATAGEAGVPFFSISGSEFVELFVGVGASRVRDLFEQAKERAPCIVFIDEVDAIGQSRARVGVVQANDEREQTLNQLLYEMDGFEPNSGVVILAATNRPDVLDRALLRAGRFDRQIEVPLPTEAGRLQILTIHSRRVPLDPTVDLADVARMTASFSGADLANLVNEAALMAVRRGDSHVQLVDFDQAMERIIAGLHRDTPLRGEVRRRVAYHESGHALVSHVLPRTDAVHRVSIIPTSRGALGFTMEVPEEDRYLLSQGELEERLAVMLGGRAAELLVFGEVSTGAANDLDHATQLARRMVMEFGMSETLGAVRYAPPAGAAYLGPELTPQWGSQDTGAKIDHEVRRIVDAAQQRALEILRRYRKALDDLAGVLQEKEALEGAELRTIVEASDPPLDPDESNEDNKSGWAEKVVVR